MVPDQGRVLQSVRRDSLHVPAKRPRSLASRHRLRNARIMMKLLGQGDAVQGIRIVCAAAFSHPIHSSGQGFSTGLSRPHQNRVHSLMH